MKALILIDIQEGFKDVAYWGGERNNLEAEQNAKLLLKHWRKCQFPIFHVQHCSTDPSSLLHSDHAGNSFQELVAPIAGEKIIRKNVNSAFIGTDLLDQLRLIDISELVICGLTTDHCVSTTTRMAANYGFAVALVEDACATFCKRNGAGQMLNAQLVHEVNIASLRDEFASIVSVEDLLASN